MYQRMEFPSIEHYAWSIWNRNHILMTFKNEQRQQHRHPIKESENIICLQWEIKVSMQNVMAISTWASHLHISSYRKITELWLYVCAHHNELQSRAIIKDKRNNGTLTLSHICFFLKPF